MQYTQLNPKTNFKTIAFVPANLEKIQYKHSKYKQLKSNTPLTRTIDLISLELDDTISLRLVRGRFSRMSRRVEQLHESNSQAP